MIPKIFYTITNRNNSNNNSNNNNQSNNNPNNNVNLNNNINANNANNAENDTDPNIHSHFAQLEQQIAAQLREQSRELQQQEQQQQQQQQQGDEGDEQPSTTTPTSTNQSVFNGSNLRFGQPVCIFRAPEGSALSSTYADENYPETPETPETEQQLQQLSTMFLPSKYIPSQSGSSNSSNKLEIATKIDDTSKGGFSDKYSLHLVPVEGNNNLFTNRISYNTQTDAYYENEDLSNKYLKEWKAGAYEWDNIEVKIEYDWMKTYLARSPNNDKMNDDGEISWKFDYRLGGFLINSLKIRLSFGTFDNNASVQWFIKPLPTMRNQNPDWNLIQFDPYTEYRHEVNEIKDLTKFVKDEYGFILKAHLSGGEEDDVIWQKTQLFRQDWNRNLKKEIIIESDNTFGLDVKVELRPDVIVDPLPKLSDSDDESSESFILNDESTSDFIIHYNVSADNTKSISNSNISFHAHSKVLSRRSDYFSALLESKMIESQSKSLTLNDQDVPREKLEFILNYLYKGDPPNIKSFDEWTTLLHYASRFLIPTLIQFCEKALKDYLNHDNLSEIESIANEYGAEQLLQCCKNYEPPKKIN